MFRDPANHILTLTNRRSRREAGEVIRILDASPLRLDSRPRGLAGASAYHWAWLFYTSYAADDLPCVDLGGRRII